jgi:HEAT repeat protein
LLKDDDWSVRQAAVNALQPLVAEDAELRATFTKLLKDGNSDIRLSVAQTVILMVDKHPEQISHLLPWLACAGDHSSHILIHETFLSSKDFAEQIRRQLSEVLGPLLPDHPDLFEQVLAMLERPDWQARDGAARALAAIPGGPPAEIRPLLFRALDDQRGLESWPARLAAAAALINNLHHAEAAIAIVLQALDYGTAPTDFLQGAIWIRQEAALILSRLTPTWRNDAVFERLTQVMQEDKDGTVRDAAYQTLLVLAQAPERPK